MSTEYGGVHVEGGTLSGAVAFGTHARATVNNTGSGLPPQTTVLLDQLDQLIAEHAEAIDQPANVARDAADVRAELASAEPDRSRVADALTRISTRAAGVTAIVELVTAISELLS